MKFHKKVKNEFQKQFNDLEYKMMIFRKVLVHLTEYNNWG